MYYNLTKKQFQKYEKDFRKTYIGRTYYVSYLTSYILAPLFFLCMNVWMILDPNKIFSVELSQISFVVVMISFLIGGTIIWVHYMKELKGFIMTKLEK